MMDMMDMKDIGEGLKDRGDWVINISGRFGVHKPTKTVVEFGSGSKNVVVTVKEYGKHVMGGSELERFILIDASKRFIDCCLEDHAPAVGVVIDDTKECLGCG